MAPLVSWETLTARPGFETLPEAQGTALLEDASALVRLTAAPYLDDSDHTTGDVPAAITTVVIAMVRRAYSNPEGLTGEQIGDYGWQANVGGQIPGTGYLTAREKKIVRRAVGKLGMGEQQLSVIAPMPPVFSETEDLTGS